MVNETNDDDIENAFEDLIDNSNMSNNNERDRTVK